MNLIDLKKRLVADLAQPEGARAPEPQVYLPPSGFGRAARNTALALTAALATLAYAPSASAQDQETTALAEVQQAQQMQVEDDFWSPYVHSRRAVHEFQVSLDAPAMTVVVNGQPQKVLSSLQGYEISKRVAAHLNHEADAPIAQQIYGSVMQRHGWNWQSLQSCYGQGNSNTDELVQRMSSEWAQSQAWARLQLQQLQKTGQFAAATASAQDKAEMTRKFQAIYLNESVQTCKTWCHFSA